MRARWGRLLLAASLGLFAATGAVAQCPAVVPAQGAALPAPLPLFPADNWWNADISAAPVDANSSSFIAFVNNGGTRKLHPDFGGEASPGSVAIYGMPYAVVDGAQPKLAVTFDYWDESDGVNMSTGQGIPFYPIPSQAIAQSALGRRRRARERRPAQPERSSSADRRLHQPPSLRALQRLLQRRAGEVVRRFRRVLRPEDEQPASRHVDVGRRGRPRDPPGARPLRRGVERGAHRHRPCAPRHRALDQRLRVSGVAPRRLDTWRPADGRAAAAQDERERRGPGVADERSEHAQDLSRDAEARTHRRGQRLRHVRHRHVRHALEQRHPQPGVRDALGERLRGDRARLEARPPRRRPRWRPSARIRLQ